MNQSAFMKILRDFDVIPTKLTVNEASRLFDITIAAENRSLTRLPETPLLATRIDYLTFTKLLGRCAVKAFFDHSDLPSHADKVTAFFTHMDLAGDVGWRSKMKTGGGVSESHHKRRASLAGSLDLEAINSSGTPRKANSGSTPTNRGT